VEGGSRVNLGRVEDGSRGKQGAMGELRVSCTEYVFVGQAGRADFVVLDGFEFLPCKEDILEVLGIDFAAKVRRVV
jgi:hypothetical protein